MTFVNQIYFKMFFHSFFFHSYMGNIARKSYVLKGNQDVSTFKAFRITLLVVNISKYVGSVAYLLFLKQHSILNETIYLFLNQQDYHCFDQRVWMNLTDTKLSGVNWKCALLLHSSHYSLYRFYLVQFNQL